MASPLRPFPREHGAWGLLIEPFAAAAILAGRWTPLLAPALGFVLLGFLLREPCLVLVRQALVWRERNPATVPAFRWLLWECAGLTVCCVWLSRGIPVPTLAALVAAGGLFTAAAVGVTMRNRQRSRLFQAASAAALGLTAPFAAFVSLGAVPPWAWQLWGLLTLHGIGAILVVHARLERRTALRAGLDAPPDRIGFVFQLAQIPVAAACAVLQPALAAPVLFSIAANSLELRRLRTDASVREPLTRVGIRTLAVSLLHSALTIACLWPAAQEVH